MIKVTIIKNEDSKDVAKLVLIDQENRVLLLKRSDYHEKFAGELDLPGGHLKVGESLIAGLKREVKEETKLDIEFPAFYKKIENINFFHAQHNYQEVVLSEEHVEFGFYSKNELNLNQKFEKIAHEILEMLEND